MSAIIRKSRDAVVIDEGLSQLRQGGWVQVQDMLLTQGGRTTEQAQHYFNYILGVQCEASDEIIDSASVLGGLYVATLTTVRSSRYSTAKHYTASQQNIMGWVFGRSYGTDIKADRPIPLSAAIERLSFDSNLSVAYEQEVNFWNGLSVLHDRVASHGLRKILKNLP
jgi:hypothetical protein